MGGMSERVNNGGVEEDGERGGGSPHRLKASQHTATTCKSDDVYM